MNEKEQKPQETPPPPTHGATNSSQFKQEPLAYSENKQLSLQQTQKKWKAFFTLLAVLNFGTIIAPILLLLSVANSPAAIIGIVIVPIFVIGALVLFINVIAISIYLRKYKPAKTGMITGIVIAAVSLILLIFPGSIIVKNNLPWIIDNKGQTEKLKKQIAQEHIARYGQYIPPKYEDITKEQAVELLNTCKLRIFYYTDQTSIGLAGGGEKSPTGIVLTYMDNEPYSVSIANRLISELEPIARNAEGACPGPGSDSWHDGALEQR